MKVSGKILSVILAALMIMNLSLPLCFAAADNPSSGAHEHVPVTVEGKKPTCTEPGLTSGLQCEICRQWLEEPQTIKPLGHDPQIAPYVPSTCTEPGYAPFICTRCGEVISKTDPEDPLGHDYKPVYVWAEDNSTVTASMTCTRCGDTEITETVGVTMKVLSEPTCTEDGEALYTSDGFACKSFYVQTKKETIPAQGHEFAPVYVWAEDNSAVTATMTCTRCGDTGITETVGATMKVTKEPTCTEYGEATYISKPFACKSFYVQTKTEIIEKICHDTVRMRQKSPTCTQTGTDTYCVCSVCGGLFEDEAATKPLDKPPVLPMLPHKLYKVPDKEPTCTHDGVKAHWRCEMCGQYFSDENGTPAMFPLPSIPATGHTPGEPVRENKIPAQFDSDGGYDEVVYCTCCGEELSREHMIIPMFHVHSDRDNDGHCDQCSQMMTGGDHCRYCGKIHTGAYSLLVMIFHSILAMFKIG